MQLIDQKKFFPSIDFSGLIFVGVWILLSLIPSFFAWVFIIFSWSVNPLPTGLSGWVTIPTTSNLGSATSSSKNGVHIGAEDINTTR